LSHPPPSLPNTFLGERDFFLTLPNGRPLCVTVPTHVHYPPCPVPPKSNLGLLPLFFGLKDFAAFDSSPASISQTPGANFFLVLLYKDPPCVFYVAPTNFALPDFLSSFKLVKSLSPFVLDNRRRCVITGSLLSGSFNFISSRTKSLRFFFPFFLGPHRWCSFHLSSPSRTLDNNLFFSRHRLVYYPFHPLLPGS